MGIIICKALPEDAYKYNSCVISCWLSAYKGIVPDEFLNNMLAEKDQRAEKYKKALTDPGDCDYYCVIYDELMIGFLIIETRNANKAGAGEIWAIYLIEEFCGKGLGKELLDFAIAELKLMGCKEITLWVFEQNMRARHFYEKHGFAFDGTKREKIYGKPLTQLRYARNI